MLMLHTKVEDFMLEKAEFDGFQSICTEKIHFGRLKQAGSKIYIVHDVQILHLLNKVSHVCGDIY